MCADMCVDMSVGMCIDMGKAICVRHVYRHVHTPVDRIEQFQFARV